MEVAPTWLSQLVGASSRDGNIFRDLVGDDIDGDDSLPAVLDISNATIDNNDINNNNNNDNSIISIYNRDGLNKKRGAETGSNSRRYFDRNFHHITNPTFPPFILMMYDFSLLDWCIQAETQIFLLPLFPEWYFCCKNVLLPSFVGTVEGSRRNCIQEAV